LLGGSELDQATLGNPKESNPKAVGITAIMRKLISLAGILIQADRIWVEKTRLIKTDAQIRIAYPFDCTF